MDLKIGSLRMDAVSVGRILGGVTIMLGLVPNIYGAVRSASFASFELFWLFLSDIAAPVGIGFLIIVASEILKTLRESRDDRGDSIVH